MYPKEKTFKETCFILDHKLNLKRLGITTTVLTDTLWGEAVVRGDQQGRQHLHESTVNVEMLYNLDL